MKARRIARSRSFAQRAAQRAMSEDARRLLLLQSRTVAAASARATMDITPPSPMGPKPEGLGHMRPRSLSTVRNIVMRAKLSVGGAEFGARRCLGARG